MDELHENEQYFFTKETIIKLFNFIKKFKNPCILCAPKIGELFGKNGIDCQVLDIDNRFSKVSNFQYFDITKPKWIGGDKFGIILCDPPFFNIKLSQLFKAIRLLSQFDFTQPILISYLVRRSKNF